MDSQRIVRADRICGSKDCISKLATIMTAESGVLISGCEHLSVASVDLSATWEDEGEFRGAYRSFQFVEDEPRDRFRAFPMTEKG